MPLFHFSTITMSQEAGNTARCHSASGQSRFFLIEKKADKAATFCGPSGCRKTNTLYYYAYSKSIFQLPQNILKEAKGLSYFPEITRSWLIRKMHITIQFLYSQCGLRQKEQNKGILYLCFTENISTYGETTVTILCSSDRMIGI